MSLEIRELIIKATIVPEGSAAAGGAATGNGNGAAGEDVITTCVEKVLEILKEKDGR